MSLFETLSPRARTTLAGIQAALPPTEWSAVEAWLSTFYRYQLEWLLDWSESAILLKARQIGASHTYAAAAVLWGIFRETTLIVSVGQTESKEVLEKAKLHAAVLRDLGSQWAVPVRANVEELVLGSGARILARPAVSGGRGFTGNVLLDEFAYHVNPGRVWDGAAAATMHGYRLRVMSTPNGRENLFHELWTNPAARKGYALHRVTIDEARADGLQITDEKCWEIAHGSRALYDQVLLCQFGVVEGALWTQAMLDASRVLEAPANIVRVIVAVDPAVTNHDGSDETGIIVVAMSADKHFYVLADGSGKFSPLAWAKRAISLYQDFHGDRIVAEENNGGKLVEANLRSAWPMVPYMGVRASVGKRARAEPVAALSERGRVHIVGHLPKLEAQLTTWQPLTGMKSPDRLDAFVWAVSAFTTVPATQRYVTHNLDPA